MEQENKPNSLKEFAEKNEGVDVEFEIENESPPQPVSWKEIDEMVFSKDRWLVKDLIPKEGITILASVSGEGKSLLVMDLCNCLSMGTSWLNNDSFKTQRVRVLYVNLEMSVSEMQRRGRLIGFDPTNENLTILNEDDFNLNDRDESKDLKYRWLLNFVYEKQVQVVVIDTFRASSGGLKEEKAEEIRAFFKKFQILKNSGVSLIFLEHVRKPMQFEGKVPKKEQLLGSQDKTANAEVLLMIRRNEEAGTVEVYQRKNRLGVERKPFSIKITDILDENCNPRLRFEYVGEIEDDGTKKDQAKELILQILTDSGMKTRKELGVQTSKQVGSRNLKSALDELETEGKIDHIKQHRAFLYFVTQKEETSSERVPEDEDGSLFD